MYILGIHYGHDATAVLMRDGEIIEAMSEERLSRQKKHAGFPHLSIKYLKEKYNIADFPDVVIVGDLARAIIFNTVEDNIRWRSVDVKPKHFLRALGARFSLLGKLFSIRDYFLNWRITRGVEGKVKEYISKQFPNSKITYVNHHLAHAWAVVPFMKDVNKSQIILTLDGAGDDLSGSVNIYEQGIVKQLHTTADHQSLGLLYCAIVDLLGMSRNEHEFKVMGLAPYAKASSGKKVYEKLKKWIWFNEETLAFETAIPMEKATSYLIANEFFNYRFDSLAYGIQLLTEELIKTMAKASIKKYNISDIAIGGGVFMNVKANQYLREMVEVSSLTITPSGGDESLAIGAVVARYSELNSGDLSGLKPVPSLYLGSSYTDNEIKSAIDQYQFDIPVTVTYYDPQGETTIEQKVAELLAKNSVVGRFKGRAEWGARALGNRSILANPMSRDNVKLINEMIKGRDFWMPFATSMLYERRNDYLEDADTYLAPYMAITFNTKPKAHTELIAALHPYDLTSRPQMVQKETNPEYHALISHFEKLTGVGGILNTSFNLHGEPNVEKPEDALRTFALSGLPYLAIGNYLVGKN
jgi:carbamoyltransferase